MASETNGGVHVENMLNREDDKLPFGLYNPKTHGKLIWVCGWSPEGKIISTYRMNLGDHQEEDTGELDDLKQAMYVRDTLIAEGWNILIPPKIEFTSGGNTLTRKQKRQLGKYIEREKRKLRD